MWTKPSKTELCDGFCTDTSKPGTQDNSYAAKVSSARQSSPAAFGGGCGPPVNSSGFQQLHPSSIIFSVFNLLRTLLHHGSNSTLLESIPCAFFLSSRGCVPLLFYPERMRGAILLCPPLGTAFSPVDRRLRLARPLGAPANLEPVFLPRLSANWLL